MSTKSKIQGEGIILHPGEGWRQFEILHDHEGRTVSEPLIVWVACHPYKGDNQGFNTAAKKCTLPRFLVHPECTKGIAKALGVRTRLRFWCVCIEHNGRLIE